MAMSGNVQGTSVCEINVTPMIDVLLVLLIIFMVVLPMAPSGLSALIPQPTHSVSEPSAVSELVVVSVASRPGTTPAYAINGKPVARTEIAPRLTDIFATRQDKTMFVKGDAELEYGDIAAAIDSGHQAGAERIGVITAKSQVSE